MHYCPLRRHWSFKKPKPLDSAEPPKRFSSVLIELAVGRKNLKNFERDRIETNLLTGTCLGHQPPAKNEEISRLQIY
ncbi:hypothetical protein EG68_00572 [Paragonimus skrjabini miyazakii]|uniref:Uncharacterized protein n=1 Tax=Paragonimus skrjabini miyazakii TaxID=59628 RepID=A0A8S9Z624_9TREM|nr:hypothetical protein EG68_00572 [Paragonimus skrjabini miyazakii]